MPMKISPIIFRAYDIRGIVGEQLTAENVYLISRAIAKKALDAGEKSIIVAKDGRLSGDILLNALERGILDSGLNVIDIGMVPTPILNYATHSLPSASGIMITGSHNPKEYNGLKIVIAGETLSGASIQDLYHKVINNDFAHGEGKYQQRDVQTNYIREVLRDTKLSRPLKVVIDCGNGVAGKIAPILYKKLGCEVIELFCEVDGHFPNHHPDPSHTKNLQHLIDAVINHKADIGLAFDGDGDRLGVVTDAGEIIWPDRQLMLFAREILGKNPQAVILYDVKCTKHLDDVIKQHGGQAVMWKTGHSFIKAKMLETKALLAGEMSGHLFFYDRWYGFDDALYAGARMLEILSQSQKSITELFLEFPVGVNTPELQIPIAEERKFQFMDQLLSLCQFTGAEISTIDGVRVEYPDSWGLIRPSNTTPNLVLRFEAINQQQLSHIQEIFRHHLLTLDPMLSLPF